jgi:hypothetical protein
LLLAKERKMGREGGRQRERERKREREVSPEQSRFPEAGIPDQGHSSMRKPNQLARHPCAKQWVPLGV